MSVKDQHSLEQLVEKFNQHRKQLETQLPRTTDPDERRRIAQLLVKIHFAADEFLQFYVDLMPDVVSEADELGEWVSAYATAKVCDPEGGSAEALRQGIVACFFETVAEVHPGALEDESKLDRMFLKWGISALNAMRARGNADIADESLQELRDWYGDTFPELFE
jgi:hypothetical protein